MNVGRVGGGMEEDGDADASLAGEDSLAAVEPVAVTVTWKVSNVGGGTFEGACMR